MLIKKYDYLPDGAIQIRKEVFVEEQGFTISQGFLIAIDSSYCSWYKSIG